MNSTLEGTQMSSGEPLVSVITPVYNGGRYLTRCIESIIAQTYQNWRYTIINNCSTDETLEIATSFADRDHRITVVTNTRFVGVIENHNIAFRLISSGSSYCKVVSADDYLYPDCLRRMVKIAETSERIIIVGSYAITESGLRQTGLPVDRGVFDGKEVCRRYFFGSDPFGAPSSLLYRSSLIASCDAFYPGDLPNADFAACLSSLEDADFAFVHQILSYERTHTESLSSGIRRLNGFLIDRIQLLFEFGPRYLSIEEIARREGELLDSLYRQLATDLIHLRGRDFWDYQKNRLNAFGYTISRLRLARATIAKILDLLCNPKDTLEKILSRRGPWIIWGSSHPTSTMKSEALSRRSPV
jgi:glycosyltransferase involved in cell wall biosynthesis